MCKYITYIIILYYIGKRKYNRGKHVEGQWVFGGVEKNDSTKMFLVAVPCRTKYVLLPLIQRWILPGSVISSGNKYNKIYKTKIKFIS